MIPTISYTPLYPPFFWKTHPLPVTDLSDAITVAITAHAYACRWGECLLFAAPSFFVELTRVPRNEPRDCTTPTHYFRCSTSQLGQLKFVVAKCSAPRH